MGAPRQWARSFIAYDQCNLAQLCLVFFFFSDYEFYGIFCRSLHIYNRRPIVRRSGVDPLISIVRFSTTFMYQAMKTCISSATEISCDILKLAMFSGADMAAAIPI